MTKEQARRELDWTGGPLSIYAPDMCIGGDSFGNYEGYLPEGHRYYECDINTIGAASRGSERLIYSDDGLIYYTGDHYETFTLLYNINNNYIINNNNIHHQEASVGAEEKSDPASRARPETVSVDYPLSALLEIEPDMLTPEEWEKLREYLPESGYYSKKDDVALYLRIYRHLPGNYMTKEQARRELGWIDGPLSIYAPNMCIGGDPFGNYEGYLLSGHDYYECDINNVGAASRGSERLVYSTDGVIYYTGDHYETFTLLYDNHGSRYG